MTLLSALSEAQEEIVEAISKRAAFINFLFGLLGAAEVPADVGEAALSCLINLTEDNKDLSEIVANHEKWLPGLLQMKEGGDMKAVAACGVLHNVFTSLQWFDHKTPVEGASDAALIPTLTRCMGDLQNSKTPTGVHVSSASPDEVLQLALEIVASMATSLQEALEDGNRHEKEFEGFEDEAMAEDDDASNAGEDEPEADAGEEEEEEDREMNDDEIQAEMDMIAGSGSEDGDNGDAQDEQKTLHLLVRDATPIILSLAQPTQDASSPSPTRAHAISALNNISWTISSIDFESARHLSSLHRTWQQTAQTIWSTAVFPVLASNTADIDLASSITSLAWAVARSVQGRLQLQGDEHKKFMALYQASKTLPAAAPPAGSKKDAPEPDAFQSLGVKSIGVLGRLALSPAPVELNREIGVFLLTIVAGLPETAPGDVVQALNELFDIYADKDFACDEAVFWKDAFYKHLDDMAPRVRKMAKGIDKRRMAELRARADEVALNLGRFLKYKKGEKLGRSS